MKNNTFLHPTFFILSLIFTLLEITTAIKVGAGNTNYTCIDKERDALLHFKAYFQNDPTGVFSTWTRGEEATNDCCQWSGVECNNQTGHVTSLDLDYGRLGGKISDSLLNLSYLNRLGLSYNYFSGTIPMFIGSMSQLTYLDLSYNYFSGTIPVFIDSMSQIRHLDLSHNYFTGAIPMFIGSLTPLRFLDLSFNYFTGIIPSELGNLTNLQYLALVGLRSCTTKNLDWLFHLSQLEHLSMNDISLAKADNWVNVILNLPKLTHLSLQKCDLSQVMHPYSQSSANSSFSSSIITLYLANNNLNSSMYRWLFPLTNNRLELLYLSHNKIDGIPRHLENLCSLSTLYISNNSMNIKFSDFLNSLSGCTSVSLQRLVATENQFTGPLSDDIQKFQALRYLDLSSNQINGTINQKIWQLTKLQQLFLFSNSLDGTISKNVGMPNFFNFEMSNIPNVRSIDLSSNNFHGNISFLCQVASGSLNFLDLSNNFLSGQIPDCLWHFKELRVLNLGQNNLFGRIPASIENFIDLEVLNLYNNSFTGDFPLWLQNCTNLKFLELGGNKFSGYIPIWIGENLPSLYALSLTSNNFFGTIPSKICHLTNLQILDVSINNLHGTIPSCLDNITVMVQIGLDQFQSEHALYDIDIDRMYVDRAMIRWQGSTREFSETLRLVKSIDLSHNNLTGTIPNELTSLTELIALNLSMNALHGEIPTKFGLMKHLLHLDLSRNHLSGHIPASMSQMPSLDYLDVSFNNLSGRIPSSTQLQSFEPTRYTGNTELCGLPLTKYCPGDKELKVPPVIDESEDEVQAKDDLQRYFYIGGATGFAIGFWTICSGLLLYQRGRHTFFEFLNNLEDWVYVKVTGFIAKC